VVSMSPYHLARRFQHSTGLPPHRFVVGERIDRAVRLLAAPTLSIATSCRWWVGFCTPSHFSTVFRRITGVSPSAYRRVAARRRSEESGGRDGIA
jgi:AraC family transcriptional regulator